MFLELPPLWIIILNVGCIPALQIGVSWLFTNFPSTWFRPEGILFRERIFERKGRFYERALAIRSWKDRLPDGALWVGGFSKKELLGRDADYLRVFRRESCRGEAAHYAQIPAVLVTLAWNPWPYAALVIVFYALLSNLPCIVVQRYTRARLGRLLGRLSGASFPNS